MIIVMVSVAEVADLVTEIVVVVSMIFVMATIAAMVAVAIAVVTIIITRQVKEKLHNFRQPKPMPQSQSPPAH